MGFSLIVLCVHKMSKKKRDYIEIIDKKIDELEKKSEEKFKNLVDYIACAQKIVSQDYTILYHYGRVNFEEDIFRIFDFIIKRVKEKVIEKGPKGYMFFTLHNKWVIGQLIRTAKYRQIPFEKLAPYLLNELGKDLAEQSVKREDVVETYGKEALEIWKLLLEKGS